MSMIKENLGQVVDSLIADLASNRGQIRLSARKSLVAMGEPAVAPLIVALSNAHRQVRWEAAKALGNIGNPAAAPALVKTLEDRESDIRWLAAVGLIVMGREGLIPLLRVLVHNSDSQWLREGAHHVLREQVGIGPSQLITPVLSALEDIEPAIQVPPAAQAALDKLIGTGPRNGQKGLP